ncbi:MAG: A24 family peptidase [Planctomycetota bacterium]
MPPAEVIAWLRDGVLLVTLGVAVYTDLAQGRVYNWCTLPAIGLGLLLNYVAGAASPAQGNAVVGILGGPLISGLAGLALAVGIFGIAYLLHVLGGGDVKLMAAVGAIEGWRFLLNAAFFTACAGALVAIGVLVWRGRLAQGLKSSVEALVTPRRFKKRRDALPDDAPELATIPYTWAIAAGTIVTWLLTAGPRGGL